MPLYYDTSEPTAGNLNSITRTATDFGIRDFLLSLNIQNPIRYPQLSTSINGAPRGGQPFLDTMVGTGAVPQQNPLEVDGVFRYNNAIIMNLYKNQDPNAPVFSDIDDVTITPIFPTPPPGNNQYPTTPNSVTEQYGLLAKSEYAEFRKLATIKNLYLDATKQVDMADYISLQPVTTAQQLPSYDEAYGQLLGTGPVTTQAADIVGSILNGQGVGLSAGNGNGIGLVPNFDIRSSLAGRVLGVAGVLNDTKLGIIGAEQLALALANNAAFNTQQAILGKLNVSDNILNLVKGDINSVGFRPNYKITVADGLVGEVIGTAERILGFNIPKSRLDDAGSIFFTESGNVSDTQRANSMLENTGKGQRVALGDQLKYTLLGTSEYDNPNESPFRSGYAPFYRGGGTRNFLVNGGQPKLYAFEGEEAGTVYPFIQPATDGSPIPEISYRREQMVEDAGFTSPTVTNVDFLPTRAGVVPVVTESVDAYGNGVSHIITPTFSWVASNTSGDTRPTNALPDVIGPGGDKKSLLGKTQKLFNNKGMINLVSVKGDMSNPIASQIQSSVVNNGISKGSAVLKGNLFSPTGQIEKAGFEAENTFCRSWTTYDRYDRVYKLIRNAGLNRTEDGSPILTGSTNRGWRLHNSERMSVLGKNGFPQIAPYKTDTLTRPANGSLPKKYMFSIENLAWAGSAAVNLLPIEQGPGDLLTGKFGRIMWFPPYDIKFSESSSLSLESNLFIGRGEPLYTYNNTERTGNLSFKILVDHPSIVNGFKGKDGPSEEFVRSWFAGCIDDTYFSSILTQEEIEEGQKTKTIIEPKRERVPKVNPPSEFQIFFPNDITQVDYIIESGYENGSEDGIDFYNGEKYPTSDNQPESQWRNSPISTNKEKATNPPAGQPNLYVGIWPDTTNYSLNKPGTSKTLSNKKLIVPPNLEFDSWNDDAYKNALRDYLKTKCPKCVAKVSGHASSQGSIAEAGYHNKWLARKRAESIKDWLIKNSIIEEGRITFDDANISVKKPGGNINYTNDTPVDSEGPKSHRYGGVIFTNNAEDTFIESQIIRTEPDNSNLNRQIKRRFYTEQDFFEELERNDRFIFDKFREKIRYFHPAFHSTTPEGLNSRLTFLLQCTRQGPTPSNTEPQNLAFGAPPVCILRIGDFYNTKIMIDNLGIDYEPLVWDLNPEGVGVQPMIANVTISFKYIGASSMYGPINKLQNALSFNYFANTEIYDPRADYIATVETIQNEKLIKNYPTDPKLQKRDTFGSNGASQETAYGLVPGLDSLTDSMGAAINKVPEYIPPTTNQTATSDNTNKTQTTTETTGNQTTVTATEPPCSVDSTIIAYGSSASDTSNPPIKVQNSTDNGSYFQFYINTTSSDIAITQEYKVTATVTNSRTNEKYEWDKDEKLTNSNFGQVPYTILFKETNPEIPQQTSTSDNSYSVLIKLTGALTACTIEFNSATITNSVSEGEEAVKKLTVDNVELGGATTEGGTLAFRIANNNSVVVSTDFKVKSVIKSTDGTESYETILKDENGNDFIYNDKTEFFKTFNYAFTQTTAPCKGLKKDKQYFLDTIFFNESGNQISLNRVNLTVQDTVQVGPKMTKIRSVSIESAISNVTAFYIDVSACQEGIFETIGTQINLLISEEEFKKFTERGIKIKLQNPRNNSTVFEKTVTYQPLGGSIDDKFNSRLLFSDVGVALGEKPPRGLTELAMNEGEYILILYYEGKEIDRVTVNASLATPFNYSTDCSSQAATPAPTSTNVTSPKNNQDSDVIKSISINKVYPFDAGFDEITVEFKWDRKGNLPSFILQDSKSYKGKVSIKSKEIGPNPLYLGVEGTFYVHRNGDTSVIFGSGPTSGNDVVLANTIDDTTAPSGKAWDITKTWTCGLYFDNLDDGDKDRILAAQKDPNSVFTINWDTGSKNNISFYLNKTPGATQPSSSLKLPLTHKDEFDSYDCNSAHDFNGKTGVFGKSSGLSLVKATSDMLNKVYDAGLNGKVTEMEVNIKKSGNKYTTTYSVVVDKTPEKIAYTGFDTRGSCGDGYIERAEGQVITGTENTNPTLPNGKPNPCYLKPTPKCLVDEKIAVDNTFDYPFILQLDALKFKQYFYQFAKPDKPAH